MSTNIEIGPDTKKIVSGFSEREKLAFYKGAQQHYIAAAEHLITKSSLKTGAILYYKCLDHRKIQDMSSKYIIKVSEKFPFKVDPGELGDEWCLLKSEQEIFDKMKTFSREQSDVSRVEYFWREVFKVQRDTNLKYGNIAKVVKACLSLSHGSAEVERGFSA